MSGAEASQTFSADHLKQLMHSQSTAHWKSLHIWSMNEMGSLAVSFLFWLIRVFLHINSWMVVRGGLSAVRVLWTQVFPHCVAKWCHRHCQAGIAVSFSYVIYFTGPSSHVASLSTPVNIIFALLLEILEINWIELMDISHNLDFLLSTVCLFFNHSLAKRKTELKDRMNYFKPFLDIK